MKFGTTALISNTKRHSAKALSCVSANESSGFRPPDLLRLLLRLGYLELSFICPEFLMNTTVFQMSSSESTPSQPGMAV